METCPVVTEPVTIRSCILPRVADVAPRASVPVLAVVLVVLMGLWTLAPKTEASYGPCMILAVVPGSVPACVMVLVAVALLLVVLLGALGGVKGGSRPQGEVSEGEKPGCGLVLSGAMVLVVPSA